MGTGMQRLASFLCVMCMGMVLPGCGGGEDSPQPSGGGASEGTPQVSIAPPITIAEEPLAARASKEFFVDVQGSSFILVADGGTASDVDIHSIVAPNGTTLVTADRGDDDLIGRNFLKDPGGSTVAGLFYPEQHSSVQPGRYSFRVRNNDFVERPIRVKAIVKNGVNPSSGTLNMNLVLCGVGGSSGAELLSGQTPESQKFLVMFNELKRIFHDAAHIEIDTPNIFFCQTNALEDIRLIGLGDFNFNGQNDRLDVLFPFSLSLPEDAVTLFLVPELTLSLSGLLNSPVGLSGGAPGPAFIPGTRHSGVAIRTFGPLANLSDDVARLQGNTMAHETAHFLGLLHTTESNGLHDPLSDTPECPIGNDANNNGLEATECLNFDGLNLMFWGGIGQGPGFAQDQLTERQRLALHRNPLIH